MNAEDGGTRKAILVTTDDEPEKKSGEARVNIAEEVTYERLKRVLAGEGWADGKNHSSLEQGLEVFALEMRATL